MAALDLKPYPPLLLHILESEPFRPLLLGPSRHKHRENWRELFRQLKTLPPNTKALANLFHDKWQECHHYVRQLVEDDGLLIDAMWVWLPRYGGEDLILYRGENLDRYEAGACGFAWTDTVSIAEKFARGLNAEGKGGIVLRAKVPASSIIGAPSQHSNYLCESEFTVDVRNLDQFEILLRFPPRK